MVTPTSQLQSRGQEYGARLMALGPAPFGGIPFQRPLVAVSEGWPPERFQRGEGGSQLSEPTAVVADEPAHGAAQDSGGMANVGGQGVSRRPNV